MMMLIAWYVTFHGVMLEPKANSFAKLLIVSLSMMIDAMFTVEMFKDYVEYKRLEKLVRYQNETERFEDFRCNTGYTSIR